MKTKFTPANKHELYVALNIKEEWETIPRKTYKKLIDSMPRGVGIQQAIKKYLHFALMFKYTKCLVTFFH